jgi:hypothetical protein
MLYSINIYIDCTMQPMATQIPAELFLGPYQRLKQAGGKWLPIWKFLRGAGPAAFHIQGDIGYG